MATDHHNPISNGVVAANALTFNAPMGELDTALGDIIDGTLPLDQAKFANATELTIAAGSITVALASHSVDTESEVASDDLDTLVVADTSPRFFVLVAENAARAVTVKHGADNIYTSNGQDYILSTTKAAMFYWDGTSALLVSSPPIARGAFYQEAAATAVAIASSDTDVIVDGMTTGLVSDVTFQNNQELKILTAGVYKVSWSLSLYTDTGVQNCEAGVAVNSTRDDTTVAYERPSNAITQIRNLAGSGHITLAVDDLVQIVVRNTTDTNNYVVMAANLTLEQFS